MKVLWLASWYPNKYEPSNGDFVQRHAMAVKDMLPIDVIHLVQLGKDGKALDESTVNKYKGLREFIHSFQFKPWNIGLIDKVRYNLQYLKVYELLMRQYEKEHGRPDIIHVHVPIKAGIIARKFAKEWNIPYIVSEQASYYESSAPNTFSKRSYFFKSNARKIFRDANLVTNVSTTIGEKIRRLFNLQKVVTVHNLVDTSQFYYQPFNNRGIFTWLHVSALNDQKNIPGMIEAFAKLNKTVSSWKLVIAGPASEEHKSLIHQHGMQDRMQLTGELSYAQVAKQMQAANAFVLFSNHENFPCVVVEALCSGLPVVAANVGGVKEAINISNGILVESGNVPQLSLSLGKMMENYHEYNPELIAANAAQLYRSKVIASQFVSLYNEVSSLSTT